MRRKKNRAWSTNDKIIEAVKSHSKSEQVRLLASVPNFEAAYFNEEVKGEKPYNALIKLTTDEKAFAKIRDLLTALVDHDAPVPDGCIAWTTTDDLRNELQKHGVTELLTSV